MKANTSTNDITGDTLVSKIGDIKAYEANYDLIFGRKDVEVVFTGETDVIPAEPV